MDTEYTESFVTYGRDSIEVPETVNAVVLSYLNTTEKSSIYAVDLGSCDGAWGKFLMERTKHSSVSVISVDPYPTQDDVICSDGVSYLKQVKDASIDLLLCKFAIHFMYTDPMFFTQIYRTLTTDGMFYIVSCDPSTTLFACSSLIQQKWVDSCTDFTLFKQLCEQHKLYCDIQEISETRQISKYDWCSLVLSRGSSHLLDLTDEELSQACVTAIQYHGIHTQYITYTMTYKVITISKMALSSV